MEGNQRFQKIFKAYYSPLCNYTMKITGNRDDAEDIVQTLFSQLWETGNLIKAHDPERYLLRSIRFKAIDYLKQKKAGRTVNLESLLEIPVQDASQFSEAEIEPLLHFLAAKLPPKTSRVFLMSRDSRLTYKEIASRMGISVKSVEGHMTRALRLMRKLITKVG